MLHRRLLFFGALIILPLAALLFYGAYQQRRDALSEARASVVRTTRAVADHHRLLLERTQQLLAVLARLPKIREEDWDATNDILADVVQQFPEYLNLRVSDLNGAMVASALPNAPASSNRGRNWFEEAIQTSSFAMSSYFVGQTTGKPEVVIGYPVLDGRNRVHHVLSVTIDLQAFNAERATLPDNSIVIVLDRSGTILARDPDPQHWVGQPLNPVAVMDALRSGRSEGVVESDGVDGTARLIGYVALPVAKRSPGVYLAIGTDRDRVLAPINRALLINSSGLVLVTAFMLGAAVIGGRRLVLAPVDGLLQVTRRIGAGDLDARANDRLHRDAGEFGELARALDDMAMHLRDRSAERVRSEQALRASESQYRRIVGTAIEGIWTLDVAGRTTFVNQKMAAMLGYGPDEMLGISFLDLMDEPARAEARAAFARREAGVSEQLDFRFRHKSGRDVWTRLATGPIVDEAGRFAGALAMATDITESRAAAEALGAVEGRLRVVLDNVTDGFFTMNREWRYTDINPAGSRMVGRAVEDLVGRRYLDAFPEAAGTIWEQAYRRVMDTGEPTTVDEYYEPLDTWFEASVFPFADGISVFFRDITIRKRAERAAQDSETRLRLTVDVLQRSREALQKAQQIAHLGNWERDVRTGTVFWSDEVYRIFGLEPQSFTPTYDAFLGTIHPDDRQRVVDAVDAALASGGAYSVEHRILRPDGVERVVHEQAEAYRDEREQPVRMIGTVLDITERHRAETALQELNATLEARVDERTRQLAAMNAELEAFSYSVSHDLRAPLRGIDGFIQALVEEYDDRLDDTARQYIARARAAAARMGGLVDELLQLSRLTRGELRPDVVDISQLARERAAEIAADSTRQVDLLIDPGLRVHGDLRLLDAVVTNLLDNAWKFTRRTPGAVIEVGSTTIEGERAFFVRDNGAGFDMAYAGKLFGAFQRLHTPDQFDGNGIGLATVQRIVHRHGGRVWAEGAIGRGATFYFTIPERARSRT